MRRRAFIALAGGAASSHPAIARAAQTDSIRHVGYLSPGLEHDTRVRGYASTLEQALTRLGWTIGRDVQIDRRWGALDPVLRDRYARELAALKPDVIVANTAPVTLALLRATQTIPIVFINIPESAIGGFVATRARPGGNITGFMNFEASIFAKWVQLLKQTAPTIDRVAYVFNPESQNTNPGIEEEAQHLQIGAVAAPIRDTAGIDAAIAALATEPRGGAIVLPGPFANIHRQEIIAAAARHRVPVIYPFPYYATEGGLIAYGVDEPDMYRRAAAYVDRILKGANPADLPVQAPTKFELIVNLTAAKAIGIEIPVSILGRADQVVE